MRNKLWLAAAVLVAWGFAFIVFGADSSSSSGARVWMFDVGQGDAALLTGSDGTRLLIDGGPDSAVLAKLGVALAPWDRRIDAILITHPDADHITGLISVLERYHVSRVYETGLRTHTQTFDALERAMENEHAQRIVLKTGDTVPMAGWNIRVLHPRSVPQSGFSKETNSHSLVLLATCESGANILFTGDATQEAEREFASVGDVDVLKLGHHGSATSTGSALLESVTPEHAFISVGSKNTYGHPHPTVLARLFDRSIRAWRTDQQGDLLFSCTPDRYEVGAMSLTF